MLIHKTSLEEIGWKPYWDASGRVPVMPGDKFDIKPNGVLEICYMTKPIQDENGKWYVNDAFLYEPLPALIAGMYNKERVYSSCTVGGIDGGHLSLSGKIEEIAMWGKSIGEAGMVNYQQNLTGMIGLDTGDRYSSIQDAIDDSLYQYYRFDNIVPVLRNFDDDIGSSVKNGDFNIGVGKHSNAVSFASSDGFISIDKTKMENDFSMSIRFYVEEKKDFVLFNNDNFMKVVFDEVNDRFLITMYPYIGNKKTLSLEVSNFKVHHWYDFGLIYKDGILKAFIDGVKKEEFIVNMGIGGVENISLDVSNVESINIDGLVDGVEIDYSAGNLYSPDSDPSSKNMINSFMSGKEYTFDTGATNIINLFYDFNSDASAFVNDERISSVVTDSVSNIVTCTGSRSKRIYFGSNAPIYRRVTIDYTIKSLLDNTVKINYSMTNAGNFFQSPINTSFHNPIMFNKLLGNRIIRLRITFKNEISSSKETFPMLTTFPGTRMKVTRREILPEDIFWEEEFRKGSHGRWGTYETDQEDTGHVGFVNNSGKMLLLKQERSPDFSLVYNGWICYHNGSRWVQTTYDNRYRKINTNYGKALPSGMEISIVTAQG